MHEHEPIYVLSFSQLEKLLVEVGKAQAASKRIGTGVSFPSKFQTLATLTREEWAAIAQALIQVKLDAIRKERVHG